MKYKKELNKLQSRTYPNGGYCSGGTPLPIPNRVVKPTHADGTALAGE